jgi:hypothetical protein
MNKSTRTIGIDSKAGRKSRTGSTVTMGVTDFEAIECQQYFMAIQAGEEPTGKIKKIELVMYSDDDLKADYTAKLHEMEHELDEVINKSDQPMIEDIIIDQDSEHLPANQGDLDIYGGSTIPQAPEV